MKNTNSIIYDVETKRPWPSRDCTPETFPNVEFCQGAGDHTGMGIACICAYDFLTDTYHVFLEDNLKDFQKLVDRADHILGFNSKAFDDKVCWGNGIGVNTTLDVMEEVRHASGQPRQYTRGITKKGYNVDNIAQVNFGISKTEASAMAPILWQRGEYGRVVSYCLYDVKLEKMIWERLVLGELIDPVTHHILTYEPAWGQPKSRAVEIDPLPV